MDILVTIKEISILIGIWVAIYGIDSWRREHRGKRQIELAEDTLALFYEAYDAISYIRNPINYESETKDIEKLDNESDAEYAARKLASVVFVRYKEFNELFNKIHSLRYRFMAQVGVKDAEPFQQLHAITKEIFVSAKMLAGLWGRVRGGSYISDKNREETFQKIEKYENVFWEGLEEEDHIKRKLDEIIKNIEGTCNAIIAGKGSIYSIINKNIC